MIRALKRRPRLSVWEVSSSGSFTADLSAAPSRSVLRALAGWCSDTKERDLCLALAARPAGKLLYDACVARPRLKAYELLAALPSCRPPSEQALAGALPRLSARYYSVASSPLTPDGAARKEIVSLCFSVVKYEAGAGTNAAHSLEGADRVYAHVKDCARPGSMNWCGPSSPARPSRTKCRASSSRRRPSPCPRTPTPRSSWSGRARRRALCRILEHRARKRRATT